MTKEELLKDYKEAISLGDTELEDAIAAKLEAFDSQQKPPQQQQQDTGNPLTNALYGFAARGNQAMAALNPWADQQRIAAEQEWVKQHPGAGVGSALADMAITVPAGGFASAPARAVGSGIIEAFTNPGSALDRAEAFNWGAGGAGVGEGLASGLTYLAKPFKKADSAFAGVADLLRQKADSLGIPLNAAQQTGNKTLQYMDSALDFIPSSSVMQQEKKLAQRAAWQRALFNQGGESADAATPEVMAAMKDRISGVYNDLGLNNDVFVDQTLKDRLDAIAQQRNLDRMDVNKRGIVQSYLDEFNVPVGSSFSGSGYQNTRSILEKQANGMMNSNPLEGGSLKEIRNSIDEAMGRSVSPDDVARWRQANNDWAVMRNIEGAINPETAFISAPKLLNNMARKEKNRVIYGKGDQELTDLAKVGKAFISEKTPDSGTAQRAAMIKLLTGAGAAGAAEEYSRTNDPAATALGGLGAIGASVLLPRQAAKMMWQPNGYLAKGLLDMSQEVIPGLTREELTRYALRGGLLGAANDARQ